MVVAVPTSPALPVRPHRCTHVSSDGGRPTETTWATPGMSIPRPSTSVAMSRDGDVRRKEASVASRCGCVLPEWMARGDGLTRDDSARASEFTSAFVGAKTSVRPVTGVSSRTSASTWSSCSPLASHTRRCSTVTAALSVLPTRICTGDRSHDAASDARCDGSVALHSTVTRRRGPSAVAPGAGSPSLTRSMMLPSWSAKPASIMQSASSSTSHRSWSSSKMSASRHSTSFPGVATSRWTRRPEPPPPKASACCARVEPPMTEWMTMSRPPTRRSAATASCVANSRVGARTSASGELDPLSCSGVCADACAVVLPSRWSWTSSRLSRWLSRSARMGRRKAADLPEPVAASARTSRRASRAGIA
mmetsp:Transcript_12478/g.39439  ORF Transcript_12478/g.39439 Transcript_12478/m.39439 type:complete len:363 (-) Transcript_12478:800-1888(-)